VISAPLPNLDTLDIEALKALVIAQHESSHQQIAFTLSGSFYDAGMGSAAARSGLSIFPTPRCDGGDPQGLHPPRHP
jgi:hypothetical protein